MPISETELQQMSYREVVELAKVNGVYQKKSAKKAALIRRLSSVWTHDEFVGVENLDPNRTVPLTPLKEVDESIVSGSECEEPERRKTFTKVKRSGRSGTSNPEVKSTEPPKRQNTFTKSDPSSSEVEGDAKIEGNQDEPKSLVREGTFTKTPEKGESDAKIEGDQDVTKSLVRKGTSTKTPKKKKSNAVNEGNQDEATNGGNQDEDTNEGNQDEATNGGNQDEDTNEGNRDETKTLVREGTFTKTPEKKESEIPVLQLNTPKIQTPIDKLSVFQRLSAKIPLSERRSLVFSEKRVSVKTSFYTPQSHKKSQLNALREARKNHITPKSLTKMMALPAMKTPVQPIIKQSATSKKKSSVKKAPNFAEIHKRNFARMESLLEHKKRLRERAELMSPGRRPQTSSSIPKRIEATSVLTKSSGNKSSIPILQKKMASKDRLKMAKAMKCTTGAIKQANEKKILKGVRTNKRFELQLALKKRTA